jgi:CheY-like chemotaxis protein
MEKLKNKTVLLVEDEERNTFAMRSFLETYDICVEVANNGEEALNFLSKNTKIDMILLDMMMPVMDGFETLAVIKKDNTFKNIPVIAVTAKAMRGDREKCLESGAWDYVPKPVDLSLLLNKIEHWIL